GWAQTANTGLVLGTVTDPAGAVVPDAKAQLTNVATNEIKEMMTNSAGQFTFPGVTPGKYKVTITKAGFATFVVANLVVDVNKSYTVDVKMEIHSGIDITDNVITGGANEAPIIPVGVDGVDEFRVGVTNNNASFGRSAGGQITLISHSGTNNYHGTAYWFHQNDNLNANTWDLNHTPDGNGKKFTKRPEQKDNRVGASFGGPIRRDKTFIFGNYEVRRFPQALSFTRLVPSDTL